MTRDKLLSIVLELARDVHIDADLSPALLKAIRRDPLVLHLLQLLCRTGIVQQLARLRCVFFD